MFKIKYLQRIPATMEECWCFFSSSANLKVLTPEYLGFSMEKAEREMYAGQIISHTLRPILNIPFEWVTEITHVEEPSYFIDEQRFGPYKFWHHEHRFNPIKNGVEIIDEIYYKLPFGLLGKVFLANKVKRDLEAIFTYRRKKLEEIFGLYNEEANS